ncbi:MAG TPA: TolC family protein [Saprospiraceae bacterium]|nr:TolC family protein [Saprospiraceae bacterium]
MKTNYYHKIIFLIIFASTCISLKAQDVTLPIDLKTVLKLAGANNLTIHEYQLKYQSALADETRSKEWWLPVIYAGASTHYLNGSAMNTDGKILTDLSRNNFWTGLGVAAEIDFARGKYETLAANQRAEASRFYSDAEKNQIVLSAVHTYLELQAGQQKYLLLQDLVLRADTLSQQIKTKSDVGLLYESDYLLSQSNFNHLKVLMLQADAERQKHSAHLVRILNIDELILLISIDSALVPLTMSMPVTDTLTFKNRPEYSGLVAELESSQTLRTRADRGMFQPKLRVGLENGAFGAIINSIHNTFQFNATLLWQIPLSRIISKGDLKKMDVEILLRQNDIAQFENQYRMETSIARAQILNAQQQMSIANQALSSATEALNQALARQNLGTAKPFEVFQAQEFVLRAQVDLVHAITEYNKAQFTLKVARGETL